MDYLIPLALQMQQHNLLFGTQLRYFLLNLEAFEAAL